MAHLCDGETHKKACEVSTLSDDVFNRLRGAFRKLKGANTMDAKGATFTTTFFLRVKKPTP